MKQLNIGIYKVGAPICWNSSSVGDQNGFCYEATKLCDLFTHLGHRVTLLSRYVGNLPGMVDSSWQGPRSFDIIYVIAGNHEFDQYGEEIYLHYKARCEKFCLIQTDSLMKISNESARLFDRIFTQQYFVAYRDLNPSKAKERYSGMPELTLFNEKIQDRIKRHIVIFGGSEKDRRDKIIEYVFRPSVDSYLKMPSMGIMNRISYKDFQEEFACSDYTIVIPTKNDIEQGHVTPKVYDAVIMGVFPLLDKGYDPKDMLKLGDLKAQLVVKDYLSMRERIEYFDAHPDRKKMIMEMLYERLIKTEYIDGSFTFKCLTEGLIDAD